MISEQQAFFLQIRIAVGVILIITILGTLHSFYVDHVSCVRNNELRQQTRDAESSAATFLSTRAGAEPAAIATVDRGRANHDRVLARKPLLNCSYPFPQTK